MKGKRLNILVFAGCRDRKLNSKISPILESDVVKSLHLSRKGCLENSHKKLKQYYPKGIFAKNLLLREISRIISGIGVLRKKDIDLIIGIHFRMHSIYTYYLAKIFNKKYGLLIIESPKRYQMKGLYEKVLKSATFIGVRGNTSLQYLVEAGVERDRVFIARNEFEVPSQPIKSQERIYDLIYIGNFVDIKDLPLWIEVVEQIKKKKEDVRAVMLGDGPDYDAIAQMIEDKDLKENIELVGRKRNVYEYIDKSKLLLMTSKSEGLPVVIIEAMSRGVPSVAPDVGDITDLVENNVNGLVLDSRNPLDFANEILNVLNDRKSYEAMSNEAILAIEKLAELCKLDILVKEWEDVLGKINFGKKS